MRDVCSSQFSECDCAAPEDNACELALRKRSKTASTSSGVHVWPIPADLTYQLARVAFFSLTNGGLFLGGPSSCASARQASVDVNTPTSFPFFVMIVEPMCRSAILPATAATGVEAGTMHGSLTHTSLTFSSVSGASPRWLPGTSLAGGECGDAA